MSRKFRNDTKKAPPGSNLILLVLTLTHLLGNPWSIDFAMTADLNALPATVVNVGSKLIFVARALERIGDHAIAIAEESFWRDQGDDIRHSYPPKK
jgi:hypothetical protein